MSGWNLNKLFGRLDIRTKLAIAFLGLAGVPLTLVGWYAAEQHLQSLSETATQEQRRSLTGVREKVRAFLVSVDGDLEFLSGSSLIESFLRVPPGPATLDARPHPLPTIEAGFEDFLRSKRHYYRLRLLSTAGVELAHVVATDGVPRALPAGSWQGTGYRFYRAVLGDADGVAFAPVELRSPAPPGVDAGEEPHPVAALSFVQSLRDVRGRGELRAILVADIDARWLFELLQPTEQRSGEILALVEPDGHYLFHSSKKTDWNTLLATEREFNLSMDLPAALAERALSGEAGIAAEGSDSVIAYAPLFEGAYPILGNYTLVSIIPKEVLFAPVRSVRRFILGAGTLTVLVAGLLALLAAHQFAAPIVSLTRDAARLARGEFEAPLEISTNDEIEDLARSFSSMATSLAARERENVRQREQLNALLDNMGEGVAVIDPGYRVRFLNRFLQERFGPADGQTCFELFLGRSSPCEECPSPDRLLEPMACPCRHGPAVDGRHYEILAYPLEDFEGSRAVLEIHRDITERRRLEEQIERYTEHLEAMVDERTRELERSHRKLVQQEKMVAVGQLAAGVAHELGTPLATILCHSQMAIEDLGSLADGLGDAPREQLLELRPNIEVVLGEADRCRGIVRELLEFSRPPSRDLERVSVNALMKRATSLVEHDLRKRGIGLRLELSDREPWVTGTENALVQVVLNLLLNAADAMPEGGRIDASVDPGWRGGEGWADPAADDGRHARGPAADGREETAPSWVTILVEDGGDGMDAATQARIFEPFFTTKDPGVGTGLGLWIAYNTVTDHGGRIQVDSVPGRGTRFSVELPLSRPDVDGPGSPTRGEAS